jgi:hypothetical protein
VDGAPTIRRLEPALRGPGAVDEIYAPPRAHTSVGLLPMMTGLPAKDDLDYLKTLIELGILLLAVPWLLKQLARNPRQTSRRVAKKQIGG